MKKENTIREMLGVTQEEMAMLLNISRSQWAMYESGQRDLPSATGQFFAAFFTYIKTKGKQEKTFPETIGLSQKELERLLHKNEYQQLLLSEKIASVEKKQHAYVARLQLVDFLKNDTGKHLNIMPELQRYVASKAKQRQAETRAKKLNQYELKQALLNCEKIWLESKIKELD